MSIIEVSVPINSTVAYRCDFGTSAHRIGYAHHNTHLRCRYDVSISLDRTPYSLKEYLRKKVDYIDSAKLTGFNCVYIVMYTSIPQ